MIGIWYSISNRNQFISVIDDEADLAYLFKEALGTIKGVDVLAFTDPILALEHFENNYRNYKCIITDFRMPTMTGVEFLDLVKNINPDVKQILVSAFDINDDLSVYTLYRQVFIKTGKNGWPNRGSSATSPECGTKEDIVEKLVLLL